MRRIASVMAFLGLLFLVPANARSEDQGLLNSVSYRPLASATAITVRPLDNSDRNMAIAAMFENALRKVGYTVAASAPLIFTFETRDEEGAWSDHGQRSMIDFYGSGGNTTDEEAKVRLNLFDTGKGGVLNEGRGGTSVTTPATFRIDVTIDERDGGKRVWQAWAVAQLGQRSNRDLPPAMVPAIVGSVGQTVKRKPFQLP